MNKYFIICVVLLLQGCSASYARLTYDFEKMNNTSSIFFDSEAKDIATQVVKLLPESISTVTTNQYVGFKDLEALEIYIFSSKQRYANYSGSSSLARGSATKDEIYLSPIIRDRIETLDNIVVHELSHIHLRQYIGTWRYWTEVPGWFHEGLAVEISGGGGAEKVSDDQAIAAIKSGKHFTPREKSGLFGHKFAHNYGLKPQLYYRQSNLFVRYLINQNPEAFKQAYLALIEGAEFKDIWVSKYAKSIPLLWKEFLNHLQV